MTALNIYHVGDEIMMTIKATGNVELTVAKML